MKIFLIAIAMEIYIKIFPSLPLFAPAITTTLFIPEIAKIIFINNWLDAVRYEMFGVLNFAVHICYILHDLLSVAFFKNLLKRFDVADEFI